MIDFANGGLRKRTFTLGTRTGKVLDGQGDFLLIELSDPHEVVLMSATELVPAKFDSAPNK